MLRTSETKKIVVILVLGAVLAALGFWGWQKMKTPSISPEAIQNQDEEILGEEKISETVKTYQDPELGVSFEYPDNLTFQQFPQDDGLVIVIQGNDGQNGFQAVVAPYEESEALSLDLIRDFAEDLTIKDEKEIALGEKGEVQAFSFTLKDPSEEEEDLATFNEIWFVRKGKLYQISSDPDFAPHMEKILQSFKFE